MGWGVTKGLEADMSSRKLYKAPLALTYKEDRDLDLSAQNILDHPSNLIGISKNKQAKLVIKKVKKM